MLDPMLIFGEIDPSGAIKRDVKICAVSGKRIEPGDAMFIIPGTGRFYRLKAQFAWHLNDGRRAAIEAQLPVAAPAKAVKASKEATE